MTLHVFLLLLLFVLMFSLARLCSLCWPHHGPAQSAAATRRTPLQRLLKPRTPHDCPACRLSCAHSSVVEPVPPTVRPWREVKSRRGAPKRVNTEGFACPNRECPSSGITDPHIHALVGDGKHGHAERIQTFRGSVCHTTFTARRHTPLVSSENPFSPDRCGIDGTRRRSGPFRSSARLRLSASHHHQPFWRAQPVHAQTLHERSFRTLQLPHLQLDELRTRLRCSTQVLWLWLAIDPCTKILPVLILGPRTQNMAHMLIHSLRQLLAAFLPPALHQ